MPELNFAKLFSILGIGLFTLLCVFYLVFIFKKLFSENVDPEATFMSELLGIIEQIKKVQFWINGLTVMGLTLLFGFGTIVHELVHKITITNVGQSKEFVNIKRGIGLQLKEDIILHLLINDKKMLTPFGVKIFSNDSIINTVNHTLNCNYFRPQPPDDIKTYWLKHRNEFLTGKDNIANFKSYVDEIAFLSKNWCYLCTERVAEELVTIDDRINFSRCIATVSTFFFLLITTLTIVILPIWLISLRLGPKVFYYLKKFFQRGKRSVYIAKTIRKRSFKLSSWVPLFLLLVLYFMAITSYPISQDNFNKRILGYYLNHFSYHTDLK